MRTCRTEAARRPVPAAALLQPSPGRSAAREPEGDRPLTELIQWGPLLSEPGCNCFVSCRLLKSCDGRLDSRNQLSMVSGDVRRRAQLLKAILQRRERPLQRRGMISPDGFDGRLRVGDRGLHVSGDVTTELVSLSSVLRCTQGVVVGTAGNECDGEQDTGSRAGDVGTLHRALPLSRRRRRRRCPRGRRRPVRCPRVWLTTRVRAAAGQGRPYRGPPASRPRR